MQSHPYGAQNKTKVSAYHQYQVSSGLGGREAFIKKGFEGLLWIIGMFCILSTVGKKNPSKGIVKISAFYYT